MSVRVLAGIMITIDYKRYVIMVEDMDMDVTVVRLSSNKFNVYKNKDDEGTYAIVFYGVTCEVMERILRDETMIKPNLSVMFKREIIHVSG